MAKKKKDKSKAKKRVKKSKEHKESSTVTSELESVEPTGAVAEETPIKFANNALLYRAILTRDPGEIRKVRVLGESIDYRRADFFEIQGQKLLCPGVTPLIAAVMTMDHRVVEAVLKKGAAVDAIGATKEFAETTALGVALNLSEAEINFEIARLLIRHGADINNPIKRTDGTQFSFLMNAARNTRLDVVQELLTYNNLDINQRTPNKEGELSALVCVLNSMVDGESPERLARQREIFGLLIQKGAEVKTAGACSPLLFAIEVERFDLVCLLLSHGAKLDEEVHLLKTPHPSKDEDQSYFITPLQGIVEKQKADWILTCIKKKIIDVNMHIPVDVKNELIRGFSIENFSLLMVATIYKNIFLIKQLVAMGADPFIYVLGKDKNFTAYGLAVESEDEVLIDFYLDLILKVKDGTVKEKHLQKMLVENIRHGHVRFLDKILPHVDLEREVLWDEFFVKIVTGSQQKQVTLSLRLLIAAFLKAPEAVQELINRGHNLTASMEHGSLAGVSPLILSISNNDVETAKVLIRNGASLFASTKIPLKNVATSVCAYLAFKGKISLLRELLEEEKGIKPEFIEVASSLAMQLIFLGFGAAVKLLFEYGLDANRPVTVGRASYLDLALLNRTELVDETTQLAIIDYCSSDHLNEMSPTEIEYTRFSVGLLGGSSAVVSAMLEKEIDLTKVLPKKDTIYAVTAWDCAFELFENNPELLALLIRYQFKISEEAFKSIASGTQPLQVAVELENEELCKKLLLLGDNPGQVTIDEKGIETTPLLTAICRQNLILVQLLYRPTTEIFCNGKSLQFYLTENFTPEQVQSIKSSKLQRQRKAATVSQSHSSFFSDKQEEDLEQLYVKLSSGIDCFCWLNQIKSHSESLRGDLAEENREYHFIRLLESLLQFTRSTEVKCFLPKKLIYKFRGLFLKQQLDVDSGELMSLSLALANACLEKIDLVTKKLGEENRSILFYEAQEEENLESLLLEPSISRTMQHIIDRKRANVLPSLDVLKTQLAGYMDLIKKRTQVKYCKSHMRSVAMLLFKIDLHLQKDPTLVTKRVNTKCHQVRNRIAHEVDTESSHLDAFCEISPYEVFEVAKELNEELQKRSEQYLNVSTLMIRQ